MANEYRISNNYDDPYKTGWKFTDSVDKARVMAGKLIRSDAPWTNISKNGHEFAIVTSHRADRFTGIRFIPHTAYYCKEIVLNKNGKFSGYKYYEFSPKTGRILRTDNSIKMFF